MLNWIKSVPADQLFLSAVTVGEIQAGTEITHKQDQTKAEGLAIWLGRVIVAVVPEDSDRGVDVGFCQPLRCSELTNAGCRRSSDGSDLPPRVSGADNLVEGVGHESCRQRGQDAPSGDHLRENVDDIGCAGHRYRGCIYEESASRSLSRSLALSSGQGHAGSGIAVFFLSRETPCNL